MKCSPNLRSKGIAGILGAVILFAMIFTTGATYFSFITLNQRNLETELLTANQIGNERLLERYTPVSLTVDPTTHLPAITGNIGINITNSSPLAVKIVAIIVTSSSGVSLFNGGQTTPSLPFYINPQKSLNLIDTGISPSSGIIYAIRVISGRGNIAQTTYPESASASQVAISLISKGVGDIQMTFQSLKWATKDSLPLTWSDGSSISVTVNKVIWRVQITNHSAKDIYLSRDCVLSLLRSGGGSNSVAFYIVNGVNEQTGALTAFNSGQYILIPANLANLAQGGTPITIYFSATTIGGTTHQNAPSQSDIWLAMIGLTGTYTSGGSPDTYAQLVPFKIGRAHV